MQVYLPDDLYDLVKARGLSVSKLLQKAVRAELRRRELLAETDRYVADLVAEEGHLRQLSARAVAIEESDEAQQPFGGEPAQLVVLELRDVGLRNAEKLGRARLIQMAGRDQFVESHRELYTQRPLVRVRKAKIHQNVTASGVGRLSLLSSHSGSGDSPG